MFRDWQQWQRDFGILGAVPVCCTHFSILWFFEQKPRSTTCLGRQRFRQTCPCGNNEFRNWCQLHSLAGLTPKTYVTYYYYLFVGNYCDFIRIEGFISNFDLWRGCLCIPEILCSREEAEEQCVVMSDAVLCDWAKTFLLLIFLTTHCYPQ